MLQSFSDRIRGSRWLGYAIVIAISIPFALWGVQAYFGGADPNVAATVNGERVLSADLEQRVAQRRQMLRQRFGGELPEALSERMLREQVLGELITREVLMQAAAEAGLRVSEQNLASRIRQQQFFQRDGQFSRELYRQTLSRAGLTPEQYEAQVREGERLEQLRAGVARTGFVLDGEARQTARLRGAERRVGLLERTRESVTVDVTEEAARSFYEENKSSFQTPHRVRAAYLELNLEALREQVEVAEDEIRAEYEANRKAYREAAERKASHILIEIPEEGGEQAQQEARERARELRERIESGADFDELAREYSDDSGSAANGGDLGYVTRGSMVDPFEEALFGLEEPGDIAGPVRTTYGFHVIRLEAVREPEAKPFSEVRDEIRKELATRRAERLFYDRVELLRNTAYENPGSLEPAAEATGLEVQRTDWFSRRSGQGLASSSKVRERAFSEAVLEERRNSELIELGKRRVAVVRVIDEQQARPQPFEEVAERVRAQLREQRRDAALDEWAEQATARLGDGTPPEELAAGEGVSLTEPRWLARDAGGELPQRVVRQAFELPPPSDGQARYATVRTETGRGVVIVDDRRDGEVTDEGLQQARSGRRQALSQAEVQAWVEALKDDAEIVRQLGDDEGTRQR